MRSHVNEFAEIRKIAITAIVSDDFLFEKVALKGGNALALALGLSDRTSLDLDFSIENDFEDLEDVQNRIFSALERRFDTAGYAVFDLKFEAKPATLREGQSPRWGGYMVTFKLMEKGKYLRLSNNIEAVRRQALVVGPEQGRTFTIDLSKYEYIAGTTEVDIDHYAVRVYSPEMIAIEKLRAIYQQMPEYTPQRRPRARARDFYDIHLIVTRTNLKLNEPEMLELSRRVFEAKEVRLDLLSKIRTTREFHRPDWDAVKASIPGSLEDFDYFFEFVVGEVELMKALWEV